MTAQTIKYTRKNNITLLLNNYCNNVYLGTKDLKMILKGGPAILNKMCMFKRAREPRQKIGAHEKHDSANNKIT